MNFKGHFCGGLITAIIGVSTIVATLDSLPHSTYAILFGLILFFSLFPDLDVGSIPQRWFYRIVFICLCYVFFIEKYKLGLLLAIFSYLPILHKHRGFTHWKITSITVPIIMALLIEYILTGKLLYYVDFFEKYWLFISACTLGWWIHLFLDR